MLQVKSKPTLTYFRIDNDGGKKNYCCNVYNKIVLSWLWFFYIKDSISFVKLTGLTLESLTTLRISLSCTLLDWISFTRLILRQSKQFQILNKFFKRAKTCKIPTLVVGSKIGRILLTIESKNNFIFIHLNIRKFMIKMVVLLLKLFQLNWIQRNAKLPVNMAGFLLPVAVHPANSLSVMTWIPGSIKDHNTICTNQVDSQATSSVIKQSFKIKLMFQIFLREDFKNIVNLASKQFKQKYVSHTASTQNICVSCLSAMMHIRVVTTERGMGPDL